MTAALRPKQLTTALSIHGWSHLDPLLLAALALEAPVLLVGAHGTAKTLADGTALDGEAVGGIMHVPDLTLAGSAADPELASKTWQAIQRAGYFGNGQDWER
jgi:hypothetical protein